MQVDAIQALVARLNSKGEPEREQAWSALRPLGVDVVPYLRAAYPGFNHGEGRAALVYHALRYARVSEDAFQLGVAGLGDRSKVVRYRACALLAYALRKDAIEPLRRLRDDPDWQVRQSCRAAEFAILERNHHLFMDRRGDGRTAWQVNPEDGDGRPASWLTRRRMQKEIESRPE